MNDDEKESERLAFKKKLFRDDNFNTGMYV